jgi:hypothetical protein
MAKVALVTLHGMGVTTPQYADGLLQKLTARMKDAFREVAVQKVYYQSILQDNEAEIWRRVELKGKVHYDDLRRFLLFGFGDAAGLETRKEFDNSVYEQAQMEVANALLKVHAAGPQLPVVFISQSLGCQVLSNYIYDAQKFARGEAVGAGIWKESNLFIQSLTVAQRNFLKGDTAMAWVSTGCNIPIFVAAHKLMDIIPIAKPTANFKWLNLYDPDDALGWPLQPLSDKYEALVEDRAINAGQGVIDTFIRSWNPLAHTAYWTDDDVVKPLASLLVQLMR